MGLVRTEMHLSALLDRQVVSPTGEGVGKVDDLIVRLRDRDYPPVTGLVANVGGRRMYVPINRVEDLSEERALLSKAKVDLGVFARRQGEVLLREDILKHRLIDVADAQLVRAWDVELRATAEGWVLYCLDTRRPARLFGLLRQGAGDACEDWKTFEPLIGHRASIMARGPFGRVRRLKPAQIADLLEEASTNEGEEILDAVHADPELEADVFEELDPDTATRLFGDRSDAEVADVISHMRADDAADAVADLPQGRRQKVLDLLPPGIGTKVLTLMGFHSASAGGLMGVDVLTAPARSTVNEALDRVHLASSVQPEALVTVHAVDDTNRLVGTVSIVALLHASPDAVLADVIDHDPVRVLPETDLVDVALLMADYNLMTVAVVDSANRLVGVVTVDDVLEATIPEDWRRREPAPRPDFAPLGRGPDEGSVAAPETGG